MGRSTAWARLLVRGAASTFLLGLGLVAAACGGFENGIFGPGEGAIEGRLDGAKDTEDAWVALLDRPDLASPVASDGTFRIDAVPAGSWVVVASDGKERAARQTFTVYAGRVGNLELPMRRGARIDGTVVLPWGKVRWATVRLPDLPLDPLEVTSAQGHFRYDALPWGCHTIEASHPGYETALAEVCLEEGERAEVEVHLAPGNTGRAGSCEPCAGDSECASGLCVRDRADEGQVCAVLCTQDSECPAAYSCQSLPGSRARACLPREASCGALRATTEHRPCVDDETCGAEGICSGGICTIACQDDQGCPGTARCVASGVEEPPWVCQ